MQNIVIAKAYRFVPPRFSPFWARLIQWYLPTHLRNSFGITSWECVGAEHIVSSLNAGSGVLSGLQSLSALRPHGFGTVVT